MIQAVQTIAGCVAENMRLEDEEKRLLFTLLELHHEGKGEEFNRSWEDTSDHVRTAFRQAIQEMRKLDCTMVLPEI